MKIENINNYKINYGTKYFLDANVLLYISNPFETSNQKCTSIYSNFLQDLIKNNCTILLNLQVFSEVINRLEYEFFHYGRKNGRFDKSSFKNIKEFRRSEFFKDILTDIQKIVKQILNYSEVLSGDINSIDLKELILNCDKMDFNDFVHINFCMRNSLKLVTHDFDFLNCENEKIEIITANNRYF